MAKTLAEMRAQSGPAPRPKITKTVTLTEGQHLLDESERLRDRLMDLLANTSADADEDAPKQPRKMGAPAVPPEVDEIRAAQVKLRERLREFQVELGLEGTTSGEWHRWKDEHPPREDSPSDLRVAGGWCNATDLFDDLGRYVATWDGEPLSPGDWDAHLAERITYADRRDLVTAVVEMFEQGLNRVPKSPSESSSTESSATD